MKYSKKNKNQIFRKIKNLEGSIIQLKRMFVRNERRKRSQKAPVR